MGAGVVEDVVSQVCGMIEVVENPTNDKPSMVTSHHEISCTDISMHHFFLPTSARYLMHALDKVEERQKKNLHAMISSYALM